MTFVPATFRPTMLLLLIFSSIWATAQHRIETIPSPKELGQGHYVSDPEGILTWSALASLNRLASKVDSATSAEIAIAIVDDFSGDDDFQFALDLFHTWGVGKDGSNNGLLLFVATEKRVYRFITGYGMESVLPDALLKRVGEQLLVPHFRAGEYDAGILAAMDALTAVILDPTSAADLYQAPNAKRFPVTLIYQSLIAFIIAGAIYYLLWKKAGRAHGSIRTKQGHKQKRKSLAKYFYASLFIHIFFAFLSIFAIALFQMPPTAIYRLAYLPLYVASIFGIAIWILYTDGQRLIRLHRADVMHRAAARRSFNKQMALPLLASPLAWMTLLFMIKRSFFERKRLVPPEGTGWQRLDREQWKTGDPYLDLGQQAEEQAGAKSYEIWVRGEPEETSLIAFAGKNGNKFQRCPECGYITFTKPFIKTRQSATTKRSGRGEKMQHCRHCEHALSLGIVVIPKKSTGSSSGGSRRSGGGGRSSSSGSWGGGRSGGGGAGGRW